MLPSVGLINRRERGVTGTSRYAAMLTARLPAHGFHVQAIHPGVGRALTPLSTATKRLGVDIGAFLAHYPLHVELPDVSFYHLATQNLATLLVFQRFHRPVAVTVHDIIPYLLRRDPALRSYRHPIHYLFDCLAMEGLRKANALISDSNWTKQALVRALGIAEERIHVVPLGIDHELFAPREVPPSFRERYGLVQHTPYVLYVGSEDPRKNLPTLMDAMARVCAEHPDVQLLKVGPPRFTDERQRLKDHARRLGIEDRVRWVGNVVDADLPMFYASAEVCVVPSLLEGFGFPVLEAMACGTRVVCADTSSLPEVAGADTILVQPNCDGLAAGVLRSLAEQPTEDQRAARRAWASRFTWGRSMTALTAVYAGILTSPGAA